MAFERLSDKKILSTNLDSFISSSLTLIARARTRKNAEDETRFYTAALNDNLTLEDQLEWRQGQLKSVPQSDRDERIRIRKEIASLKDLIEQKRVQDEYTEKLTDVNSGIASADSMLSWLKSTLSRTTDPAIQKTLKENIATTSKTIYDNQQKMLDHQVEYATNSKSLDVIDTAIKNVSSAKAKAMMAGLDENVALYDLQLQNLQKTKAESTVSDALLNMAVGTATGQSSIAVLNDYNNRIGTADETVPVTIGGQRYDNVKQFWTMKRGEFLNDQSANGFFTRYQSELQDKVDYKESSKSLSNTTLTEVQSWYDSIKDRPELADYATRIQYDSQKAMQYTADKRATQIVNDFALKEDPKTALNDLAYIQDKFGVNQTLNYQKIVSSAASQKQDQVQQILTTMNSIMQDNPGMSQAEAMNTAIKSGAGAAFSPMQLATSSAAETITKAGDQATKQQFENPQGLSQTDIKPFSSTPSLQEGQLVKSKDNTTVYRYENGALRPFQGSFSPEEFKNVSGKTFADVQTVDTIQGIPTGAAISKTDRLNQPTVLPQNTPDIVNPGEYIPDPGLLKYYTPDQIQTVGVKKFLKSGTKPIWDRKLTDSELTQYKPDQILKTDSGSYLKKM